MDEIVLQVEADINPTESEEKVKLAFENLFGDIPTQIKHAYNANILWSEVKSREPLMKFRDQLRMDRIRDAARKALFAEVKENAIKFCLNKQVAYAGHVSFSEPSAESPLGPIRVTIKTENPEQLIACLAPKTVRT
jgi:predicted RNA binding protein with dsRBD fold (UPF0201 family)